VDAEDRTMIRRGLIRSEEMAQPVADPLDLFASGDPPAFATDTWHRVTFWNRGAERILGRTAEEVLGKVCFEIVGGRDVYGNRFCYEKCPLFATIRKGEPTSAFDLVVQPSGERRTLSITTLQIKGSRPELFTLVHILRPVDEVRRVARMLADLGAGSVTLGGDGCVHHAPAEGAERGAPPLTAREREILRCVATGLQNKEIAQRLNISLATVRNHIHNILEKLGVHSKLEAVSLAFRSGWVTAGEAEAAERATLQ
jgi:DNA-binding CsgD family transcriptional regulator